MFYKGLLIALPLLGVKSCHDITAKGGVRLAVEFVLGDLPLLCVAGTLLFGEIVEYLADLREALACGYLFPGGIGGAAIAFFGQDVRTCFGFAVRSFVGTEDHVSVFAGHRCDTGCKCYFHNRFNFEGYTIPAYNAGIMDGVIFN